MSKRTLIIFDSYDCTGKTTYSKELSKKLDIKIAPHFTSQQPRNEDHRVWAKAQYFFLTDLLNYYNIQLILDRWIMTEYCYSPVLRGYNIDYFNDIENNLLKNSNLNFLWVYLTCNDENVFANRFKDEKFIKIDQFYKIRENYENLFDACSLNKIKLDTSNSKNLNSNIAKIYEYCK